MPDATLPDPADSLDHLEARVTRWRRDVFAGAFAREAGQAAAVALVVSGAAALVARAQWGLPAHAAWWFALALVPALAVALVRARARVPDRAAAAAAIDLAAGGSGLVLAAFERHDRRWSADAAKRARSAGRPETDLGAGRWFACTAAAAFALLAWLVPIGAEARADDGARLAGFAERLAERLAALQEEGVLDPARAAAYAERLEGLGDRFGELALESAVEALDRLSDDLGREAEDLREVGERRFEALEERLGALAEAALAGAEPEQLQAAAEALGAALEDAAALAQGAAGGEELATRARELAQRLGASARAGDLAQGLELSDAMRQALEERLARLADRGLLSDARIGRALDALAARAAFAELARSFSEANGHSGELCPNCAAREAGECSAEGCEGGECEHVHGACTGGACPNAAQLGSLAGSGGVSRGPGAAAASFAGEGRDRAQEFRAEPLARIGIDDPERELERFRVEAEEEAVGEVVGSEGVHAAAGDGAGRRQLSPRHRAALDAFYRGGRQGKAGEDQR